MVRFRVKIDMTFTGLLSNQANIVAGGQLGGLVCNAATETCQPGLTRPSLRGRGDPGELDG
jgi:hypothetical protein